MNADLTPRLRALVSALADALGTFVKSQPEVSTAQVTSGDYWLATLNRDGENADVLTLAIDQQGASRAAGLIGGSRSGASSVDIPEILRRAIADALAAVALRPDAERLQLTLGGLELASGWTPAATGVACAIGLAGLTEPLVVAAGLQDATPADVAEAPDFGGASRFDVILDIDLPVVVRFGHTELSIRALSRLGPGSVIDLGRSPDDPVEVLVSNRVVAHGEVVIVGGNYGVRILDVASRSERAHSMEA